jgi:8-oxo-dGTP pyrophosphatase MutT (NUDIX family)
MAVNLATSSNMPASEWSVREAICRMLACSPVRGAEEYAIHDCEDFGSVGDSYDNALAETINGLYKAEVIHRRGPWRSLDAVEFATLEWVDWFEQQAALRAHRQHPAGGSRGRRLCRARPTGYGRVT